MTRATRDKSRGLRGRAADLPWADLQPLFDALAAAKLVVDVHGRIVLVNRQFSQLFGYDAGALCGQPMTQLLPPRLRAESLQRLERALRDAQRGDRDSETVGMHKDGHEFAVEASFSQLKIGAKRYAVISICDLAISQSLATAQKLQQTSALRQAMLDGLPFSAIATNEHGLIIGCNLHAQRLLGYTEQELLGRPYLLLLDRDELAKRAAELPESAGKPAAEFEIISTLRGQGISDQGVWTYIRKSGTTLKVNIGVTALRSRDDHLIGYLHMADDHSERQRSEAFVRQMASRDPLTDLPNRALLMDRLDGAIRQAQRHKRQLAVLMLDLDRFKHINDTLGHAAGDHLLITVARRLTACVREADTVSRLGGDEFVLVLNEVDGREALNPVLDELVRAVSVPLMVDGTQVKVTPSIGAALFPEDGTHAAELLRHADAAMFLAKHSGRAGARWFTPSMLQQSLEQSSRRAELQLAISEHQLVLHYQPEISLGSLRIEGMEALLRWQHPRHGLLMPDAFMDNLDDSKLSLPLLRWTLDTACREAAALRKMLARPLRLTLNLSGWQLHYHALPELLREALRASGLPPAALTLEVNEASLIQNPEASMAVQRKLRASGVSLGVDDFGSGPTSLSMLTRIGVEHVKIDRSFVRDMLKDHAAHKMVDAIIALGYGTGIHVAAKGVETLQQQRILQERGCHYAQGFLYGEAVPADAFAALVTGTEKAG